MAKVVKKKRALGGRTSSGGASGKKVTPLRPYRNPQTPPCQPGCPIGNDARGALAYVGTAEACQRDYDAAFAEAFYIFAKTNPMPAITGRLCTRCCEGECNRQHKDGAVNINKFERFLGDYAVEKKLGFSKLEGEQRDGKIAVVGSGPAGLSCAYQLARRGWSVTIFEANDKPGGFLRYVAPFRLPKAVLDREIQRILELGVELRSGVLVGKEISIEQLQKDFKAVFIAVGAHGERDVGEAWQADNAFPGVGFMARVNKGERVDVGSEVVVMGGGNPALDVARACKRLGANTTVVYRRSREDMPAFAFDVEQAEAEGIKFEFLTEPVELVKEGGKAVKLRCQRMKLGHPDGRGRQRPEPVAGELVELPLTSLIQGQIQEPDYADPLSRVGIDRGQSKLNGSLKVAMPGLFGGGDANKLGHVTVAIAQGRLAAEEIDAELGAAKDDKSFKPPLILKDKIKLEWYKPDERHVQRAIPVEERFNGDSMLREVDIGLSREDAIAEGKRCFSCGMCMDCDNCWMYCQDQAVDKLAKTEPVGQHYKYKHDLCTGCEKCAEECPCGYLKMQ